VALGTPPFAVPPLFHPLMRMKMRRIRGGNNNREEVQGVVHTTTYGAQQL
jgi:hypothetical protein